jgi:AcrR family transcriptional regulator
MGRRKTLSDADLLAMARQVFVEKGFGASTREIARRAGVSEGVLFQRYATKSELFFAAMILPAADLTGLLRTHRLTGPRDLERIAMAMVGYFRSTMPVLLSLMSRPGFRFEEFARRHPDSPLDAMRRGLVMFLDEQRQAGRIAAVDPGGAALTIFALAESVAFFEQMGAHGGRMPEDVLRRAARCLWDGLAPRTPTRPPGVRSGR